MSRESEELPVSRFKAEWLRIVESVRREGREYVITKHGVAVARIVPVDRTRASPRGAWKGRVEVLGDIVHTDWSDEFEVTRE
jgi:prevent-host-death family protein